jgi:hypothetical protein
MLNLILYIDPNTGSYLFQVIIVSLLAIVFFFKNIKVFFKVVLSKVRNKIFGNGE